MLIEMGRIAIGVYIFAAFTHHAIGSSLDVNPLFSVKPSRDYMVCRPISGIFGTKADKDGAYPVLRGPEGRPGPQGRSGSRGRIGIIDYDNVENTINGGLQDIYDRIYALEKDVERFPVAYGGGKTIPAPTKSPEQIENEKECMKKFESPIVIETMCYNILGGEGLLWRQHVAQTSCEVLGGNLADLESRELYDALYNLADERYSTVISAWTGMRYEDKKLLQRDNDTVINYAKWGSGYPRRSYSSYYSQYNKVYLILDTSSHGRRLVNSRATDRKAYAVCSYDLIGNSTLSTTVATGGTDTTGPPVG